ncbi:hypothetical protein BAUCODRAFT_547313 [Baudoinia panamericana UAMH 10762]|uniref:Uncharacterized protein n=1 Tax=Baudoinia panamericana (strain UAMH 10762) TaxID=717646 RepID=M2N5T4_BAUPA|nr:uncharacterized protein BAUCODRAFT_547313 [Baudoinia panamericana UAMH 10762]EMC94399.1 hypothetical protein BAUCODRAFT_547313 [Baudoinia panamericana UAMH 10762]
MSAVETIRGLTNTYHAYVFGTAFWYFLRGFMRVVAPKTVAEWFRPPSQAYLTQGLGVTEANDLELYNIRTDAWGLIALALLLIALADAVPLPSSLVGSSLVNSAPSQYKKPYARAAVLITIFHHVTTGIGAYQHWRLPSHHNVSMDIGVYGNIGLTLLGIAALYGLRDEGLDADAAGKKKA